MGDTTPVAWLRFRTPGVTLRADEVLRRLGRAGAGESLREVTVADGHWEPGRAAGVGPFAPGTALCLPGRPVRALRAPELRQVRVLTAPLPWREAGAAGWQVRRRCARPSLWELEAETGEATTADLLSWLAVQGSPVVGDVRRGGVLVAGGLRVCARDDATPADWWPEEPPFPPQDAELEISEATRAALQRGHPWVLSDAGLGDVGRFPSGHRVRLGTRAGGDAGLARIEGAGRLAARRWAAPGSASPEVGARVAAALERRACLHQAAGREDGTDAYRLIHGEADGLPGLAVDRLGSVLRILVQGRAALTLRDEVAEALHAVSGSGLPAGLPRIEVVHLRKPEEGWVRCATALDEDLPLDERGRLVVREAGLQFEVDPGLAEPRRARPGVGLFLDQRANRERVRALARGGRFANLFAHTGAFSAALLAGGAREVWSVDLSAAYLGELEANLARNDLGARAHHAVKLDARRFLERAEGPGFDGLIIDPPTAAAAGRRYWSVRRDLEPLLKVALRRLAPGGFLLVTRNAQRRREPLSELLLRVARRAGAPGAELSEAPAGPDFPGELHFPEGDPFEGILLRLR
ncbi:MAG: hypothetical protein CL910_16150 [Deltaproteobacteria bacterium]|nr:hypothetical protein [Deltaproteobacteria bacterium]